ncbi:cob(I)yrinic acid a,c-diamide adenosyltransferase [Candidatus Micrarchaeota archaeon]|nr:cob(I)yrinic acid a,c-diamide adenosyltransferase [Candidatus Micrarchaeota archaeon]MBU1166393.1 cob(I)yrinic acid a,c-diamide adenosyltransferase [Candidatus Micrarchaeota archaeon]MBU1887175.1 cob(I)yrinic acid a,c-diamide adenosyltransferase [Candidatus Micrarchaeota archaeon]
MAIYTKFGDAGTTGLYGGTTVPKNDLRIVASGSIDELNSVIGVVLAFCDSDDVKKSLSHIQKDLFLIGTELASKGKEGKLNQARVREIETEIDSIESKLPPLNNFILPGGSKTASLLHHARTVCRRAERDMVSLSQKHKINQDLLVYLNRTGDLLFMFARYINYTKKVDEVVWKRDR